MSVVPFDAKPFAELAIHRLDDLSGGIRQPSGFWRHLILLVVARRSAQARMIVSPQFSGLQCADVRFVTQHFQVRVLCKEFKTNCQISRVGWRQFKGGSTP